MRPIGAGFAVAVALGVVAVGQSAPEARADDGRGVITVTVPPVPYSGVADTFVVGPLTSRLHVLANDTGRPDPASVRLVSSKGAVSRLDASGIGTLTLGPDGTIDLAPDKRQAPSASTFRYRARSTNGATQDVTVTVKRHTQVLSAVDDKVTLRGDVPPEVVVDQSANDTLLVPGAVTSCPPTLSTGTPEPLATPVDVEPEPTRPDPPTCPAPETVTTSLGDWSVRDGKVVFAPAPGFHGKATIRYAQRTDLPTSQATATITVQVAAPPAGAGSPGPANGGSSSPGSGDDGSGGSTNGGGSGTGNSPGGGTSPSSGSGVAGGTGGSGGSGGAPQTTLGRWLSGTISSPGWWLLWPVLPAAVVAGLHVGLVRRRRTALDPTPVQPLVE
ncbi:Ig-like domain-containing protein [Intrasporangium mesophilum]